MWRRNCGDGGMFCFVLFCVIEMDWVEQGSKEGGIVTVNAAPSWGHLRFVACRVVNE